MLGFNVGLSALRSSQTAMDVIANNIANANTPGYHRQVSHQVQNAPLFDGNFWRGTGVNIAQINQIASRAVETAFTESISDLNRVQPALQLARQIENHLDASDGSIHQRLQDFFGELHQLQGQPDNSTQRRIVVNRSQSLTNEFNSISSALGTLRATTRQQIETEVRDVNTKLESLANLNRQISRAQAQGQQPNGLLDSHQQLVNSIAETLDIEAIPQETGFAYQFAQSHVSVAHTAFSVSAEFDNDGSVVFTQSSGELPLEFGGGRLAAYQHTLNSLVPDYENRLDQLASSLVQSVNHVQSTGISADGPFEKLTGHNAVTNSSIPLADAGLPFDVVGGELFVSVTDAATGIRTQHRVPIDPETQSLDDIAVALGNIPNLQAVVNPGSNALSLQADSGYRFDFAGQLPSQADRTSITGDAGIEFAGIFDGIANQDLNFRIEGTGLVGVASDLVLVVSDENNQPLQQFNIGAGYEPGTELDLGNGLAITLNSGLLNDTDSFSAVAVADADTSRLLVGLGLNSWLEGSHAGNIRVAQDIANDPDLISTGRSANVADGSNVTRLLQTRNQPEVEGQRSFEDFMADMTSDIAVEVNELSFLQSDLGVLHNNLLRERESISGVDPNEEMIQMLQYQRSFQAAVRVITTIDETLSELMSLIR